MTVRKNDPADAELKARHRAMWDLGDYPAVALDVIPDLGAVLVEACGVKAGDTVLDVACGSGNATIPAALKGARATGCDLSPTLLDAGRRLATARGADVTWREGDAESLPFADGEFDVVVSCVGVMFAPHHQAVADELLRVCRAGGTIGLASWTPEGFVGQMFATMKPYSPPPPPGAQPPPQWGDEEHVRRLFGNRVESLRSSRETVTVDLFETAETFRDYFKTMYGPVAATYQALAAEPDRAAALDRDLSELAQRSTRGPASGVMDWEYLLVVARRSA
ncbi:MAG: class I SAM-dependent methyltransferase [Acidimicrobiales bacterium]